jgi:hypothetical protein
VENYVMGHIGQLLHFTLKQHQVCTLSVSLSFLSLFSLPLSCSLLCSSTNVPCPAVFFFFFSGATGIHTDADF